jgi:hypothetical protein
MTEKMILVRCDCCQSTSDMEDLNVVTETEFRRDLKANGWQFERETRLHEKMDRCPQCAIGGRG